MMRLSSQCYYYPSFRNSSVCPPPPFPSLAQVSDWRLARSLLLSALCLSRRLYRLLDRTTARRRLCVIMRGGRRRGRRRCIVGSVAALAPRRLRVWRHDCCRRRVAGGGGRRAGANAGGRERRGEAQG